MRDIVNKIVDIEMVRKLIYLVQEYRYYAVLAYDWCDHDDDLYCALLRSLDEQAKELGIPAIIPEAGDYHKASKNLDTKIKDFHETRVSQIERKGKKKDD
jgi:hypothetical protein